MLDKAKNGSLRSQLARRFGWGLADQMMSSLSNAALSFYVARELGPVKFGAFSVAYVTYSFALNASRGVATDPLLVRYSNTRPSRWRRGTANASGMAAVVGLLTGVITLVAAIPMGADLRLAFVALGLSLPGLMLQDSWRYAFIAQGRGSQAFLNDTVWTLAMLPAMLILRITGHTSVFWFVLLWGGTAYVAAAVGLLQARLLPNVTNAWLWIRQHRDLAPRYLLENTTNSGAAQLRLYCVGALAGLAAVGYVQAAALLMGPFLVIFMGISLVTVPEAARILRRSPRRFLPYCVVVGFGLAVCGLLWGLALIIALPHGLGALLLGQNLWRPAAALVLPYTAWVIAGCFIGGATAGLRALGASRRSLRAMIISSVFFLGFGVGGAYLGGASGTVQGAAIATTAGALVWWWQLWRAMAESPELRRADGRHRRPAGSRPRHRPRYAGTVSRPRHQITDGASTRRSTPRRA